MFHNKLIVFGVLLAGCTLICAELDVSLGKATLPAGTAVPVVPADDVEKKTTSTTTMAPPETSSTSTSTTSTPTPSTTKTTSTTTTTTTSTTPATTAAPDTTTTPAPPTSTTPAPGPYPEPSIVQWNSTCILVKMAAQLNFTYETKDNKTKMALYNIPSDAVVDDAHCSNVTQSIQINWGPIDAQHTLLLQFDMKDKTAEMVMMRFIIPIVGDRFPDAMENQTVQLIHNGSIFQAPVAMSYHCTRAQTFNLTETLIDKQVMGTVTVRDVQVEAFRSNANSTVFSTARDCDSSSSSDIVPFAVGIALVSLIIIVLVAYLTARRRSATAGYLSF